MLQQSQAQYATLEKKYSKVKKMLRDFQQRDRDMVSKVKAKKYKKFQYKKTTATPNSVVFSRCCCGKGLNTLVKIIIVFNFQVFL